MYTPEHFAETDENRLFDVIDEYSFATLVSVVDGAPFATHLPFILDRGDRTLYAHLARANPHAAALQDAAALTIFQGPHVYISPRWYVTPNVPTWNYVAVHVYGTIRILDDSATRELLEQLVERFESGSDGWRMDQVAEKKIDAMLRAITGFALPIERIEGKFKLSQNRTLDDQRGAIAGLRAEGDAQFAELMRERLESTN